MLKMIYYVVVFVILLLLAGLFLVIRHILGWLKLGHLQVFTHWVAFSWARLVVVTAGVKVRITGLENIPAEGPAVFVSNHQGNFDIPVLLGYINKPLAFLAKKELAKIPIIHSWMEKMQCVFIDRGNLKQSIKAIQQSIEVVRGGQSMVIFPEGTRSKGPEMGEFKKGSLRVAEKSGAPVVPVTINGTYNIMETAGGTIKGVEVRIIIAPPIYPDRLPKEEQGRLHDIVKEVIAGNLE